MSIIERVIERLEDIGDYTMFTHKVVEILEEERDKGDWVSVDERLPEAVGLERSDKQGTLCLAMTQEGKYRICYYTFIYNKDEGGSSPGFWCKHHGRLNVTHWQPLPAAPRGE